MPDRLAVEYRPMTAADIDATGFIRKAALEGLARGQNQALPPWSPRRYPHFEHLLRTDPGGAWIGVAEGTAVGYAMAFTRGDIWFLSQLFVLPEVHSLGVGASVLDLAMDYGRRNGARVFSVVSSTSAGAQALYMRAGMFGIGIGYQVNGPVSALTALPAPGASQRIAADVGGWSDRIGELDRAVFGAERGAEHALYLAGTYGIDEEHASLLIDGDALAGYVYASDDGHIGPLAAADPAAQLKLLRTAGDWFAERNIAEARAFIISSNQAALGTLLRGGWRVRSWTFLLANQPFGQFDRYIPGNGLLL